MPEFDWISRYFAPLATPRGAAGLTDDVAGLSQRASVVTVDALVEGVHFLPDDPIDTVARKLVRVNVSDLIAKGARPDEAVLTLGWPKARGEAEIASFAAALGDELALWGASLVGGDTVSHGGVLFASLTLTGRLPEAGRIVRRSGGRSGDLLWISGTIGRGGQGLADALAGLVSAARTDYRIPPLPPLELADLIQAVAGASMDVSDGLIGDLEKLALASGCRAHLRLDDVPLASGIDQENIDQCLTACTAGDDYQCLFATPPEQTQAIKAFIPACWPIGSLLEGAGLELTFRGKPVNLPDRRGFAHQ
ncbi:MAG: thiamine-phosphate kinase [Pseudomonadota bacterium]